MGAVKLQKELEYMGENTLMTKAKAALQRYGIPTSPLEWNNGREEPRSRKALWRRKIAGRVGGEGNPRQICKGAG